MDIVKKLKGYWPDRGALAATVAAIALLTPLMWNLMIAQPRIAVTRPWTGSDMKGTIETHRPNVMAYSL